MQNVHRLSGVPAGLTRPNSTSSAGVDVGGAVRDKLANPVMGFAPWILFSVIEGPGRFDLAAGAALGAAILILVIGLAFGVGAKLLDLVAIAFFAAMVAVGVASHHNVHAWIERWGGEISDVMILLVSLASMAVRRPFTIQYAREQTDPEAWDTPLFLHVNEVLTWVWTGAFFVTAAVGWYGDGPMHQPDNIWTNWIVSIGVLIFAIRFTEWYPARAQSRPVGEGAPDPDDDDDGPDPRTITMAALFLPLAAYLVPLGLVFLVFDTTPWWIGVGLIVLGSSAAKHLKEAEGAASN